MSYVGAAAHGSAVEGWADAACVDVENQFFELLAEEQREAEGDVEADL